MFQITLKLSLPLRLIYRFLSVTTFHCAVFSISCAESCLCASPSAPPPTHFPYTAFLATSPIFLFLFTPSFVNPSSPVFSFSFLQPPFLSYASFHSFIYPHCHSSSAGGIDTSFVCFTVTTVAYKKVSAAFTLRVAQLLLVNQTF